MIVHESYVDIVGEFWWPYGAICTVHMDLSSDDIETIRAYGDGAITREGLGDWVDCHSGDFARVDDFCASVEGEELAK